jgi:pimeloyl-ACP methyl ester carboxylesterase
VRVLHLLLWPLVLLPAAWWAWHDWHSPPDGLALPSGARLEWTECWFDKPWWRPMSCGRFYTAPQPGTEPPVFALPVVYLPEPGRPLQSPPTLYIAGGPGGSAWLDADAASYWPDWAELTDWPGGLVVYDQRGVGLSQPAYDCPELRAARRALLPLPLPTEEAYRRMREASRACHDRLREAGVGLAQFTTRQNAADATALMRSIGFERWNVYGVSYGTRVALEMMRSEPQHLRAVVLDSPYPPQVNAELEDAWLLHRALGLYARICELAGDCADTPAELRDDLRVALERVRREGIKLSVRDPDDGRDLAVVYDDDDFAWLLFEAMYRWDAIPGLPASVRALVDGRLDSHLRGLIQESVTALLDDAVSDAIASSVDCHDAGPVDLRDFERRLAQFPDVAEIKRLDWQYHACRYWASGDAGAGFRAPVRSDVPALLLVGEFDPVTPPQWAEAAARTLSRALLFEFPAIGHGVLDSHVCAADIVRAFLADPIAPRVPACLAQL